MNKMDEFITIIGSIVIPALVIFLLTHHRNKSRQRLLGIKINYGYGVNESSNSTYLALLLTITNKGESPIFIGGTQALDSSGELCYPSLSVPGGTKLEAGEYITGNMPAGHLLNPKIKKLWVIDGTGKRHKVKQTILNKALHYLTKEQERLASLGLK